MEQEAIKQALMTIGILGLIFGWVWFKWRDEIVFNYHLIKEKISPSKEGFERLQAEAFAPQRSIPQVIGNWLEGFKRAPTSIPVEEETDYYKIWADRNPHGD